jgi:hypothetical protein
MQLFKSKCIIFVCFWAGLFSSFSAIAACAGTTIYNLSPVPWLMLVTPSKGGVLLNCVN